MSEELRQEQQHLISVERVKKTLEAQIHELTVSFQCILFLSHDFNSNSDFKITIFFFRSNSKKLKHTHSKEAERLLPLFESA